MYTSIPSSYSIARLDSTCGFYLFPGGGILSGDTSTSSASGLNKSLVIREALLSFAHIIRHVHPRSSCFPASFHTCNAVLYLSGIVRQVFVDGDEVFRLAFQEWQ